MCLYIIYYISIILLYILYIHHYHSVEPWKNTGLNWDTTCHDSFAASNLTLGSTRTGAVADKAAAAKRRL